jgi:phosphate transport system substrate-binding protein
MTHRVTTSSFHRLLAAVACGLLHCAAAAQPPEAAAPAANPLADLATIPYQPKSATEGAIRLAGSSTMQQAAAHWCQGFARMHPGAKCSIETVSSDAGLKALADGKADIALSSRPITEADRATWDNRSDRRLVVVVAGFDHLVWIVHASNPIAELPWSPETGILRLDPKAADAVPHWGVLNGSDTWKDVPVRVHGRGLGSGTRWHMDRLLAGAHAYRQPIAEHGTEAALVEAVAADRGGLGLVGDEHAHWPGVKRLPLVVPANASPISDAVVGSDRTPDCRPLFLAVAVPKAGEMPPAIREFMAYVLSYPGQLDVAKDGLLPLTRGEIHAQQELLGWAVQR